MKNRILITTLYYLLFACSTNEAKRYKINETTHFSKDTVINHNSEKFFPETKTNETFDTLLSDKQIQISIIKSDLDTYVSKVYQYNGVNQIDKYRDSEVKLIIKQKEKILLDTVFRKEQFSNYGENGFMDIAIFHNYWFKKLDKNQIELFGVINEPETDWAIDFHHYFDLKTNKLTFKVERSDEE